MKIVYVYADSKLEWNCSEWRCAVPVKAIQRSGRHQADMLGIQSFSENSTEAQNLCMDADVIVIQRNLFGPVLPAIQRWKARDKVVVADFDDAYHLMPATVKNSEFWNLGKLPVGPGNEDGKLRMNPPPITQFKWGLRMVHGATTPSRVLADDWRDFTETYYLPNYFDLERYTNITSTPHEGIVIGWGGSLSHFQSFRDSGLLPALVDVCQARSQVKVMICGDPRVYDAIPLPEEKKIFQPWVVASEWPRNLSRFDIGLAPLAGAYDDRRSWIKVMEFMLMKIPWVASDGPAYEDLRSFGWLVKNSRENWERILFDMVDHLDDYKVEANGEPYLFALGQGIDENVEKVINIYLAIRDQIYSTINMV